MQKEEFEKRTMKFLSIDERARYGEDFEPAYMECGAVDKDDFCAILQDEVVRKIVISFSKYVLSARAREKDADKAFNDMVNRKDTAEKKAEAYRKSVSLIMATCDRVLASHEKT